MSNNIEKQIGEILKRLNKIEKVIFSQQKKIVGGTSKKDLDFSGPKGGILFLESKGFFSKKRSAREVMNELGKNDYHYQIAVVQTTLNRLSDKKGPFNALREAGQKVYVRRK